MNALGWQTRVWAVARGVTLLVATTDEGERREALSADVARAVLHLVMDGGALNAGLQRLAQRTVDGDVTHVPAFTTAHFAVLTVEVLGRIIQVKLTTFALRLT